MLSTSSNIKAPGRGQLHCYLQNSARDLKWREFQMSHVITDIALSLVNYLPDSKLLSQYVWPTPFCLLAQCWATRFSATFKSTLPILGQWQPFSWVKVVWIYFHHQQCCYKKFSFDELCCDLTLAELVSKSALLPALANASLLSELFGSMQFSTTLCYTRLSFSCHSVC